MDPEEDDPRGLPYMTSAYQFCRIASGIQLIRDVAHPYVLKNNRSFEGCLYNYLRRCPSQLEEADVPDNVPKSHKWWQHAMGTKHLHSIWNVRAGTLDTVAGTLAKNEPEEGDFAELQRRGGKKRNYNASRIYGPHWDQLRLTI